MSVEPQRVHIEFQRVQTWLFSTPRLRAMVGANALLGKTLRITLPELARSSGSGWALAPATSSYPASDAHDPLSTHDDPAADAKDGILSRDGGHFEAQFATGADAFADAAEALLLTHLPGIRYRISVDRMARDTSHSQVSTELPVLLPCEWTGRGVASAVIEQGEDRPAVSLDVRQRQKAAKSVEHGNAADIASLLSATTKLGTLGRDQELKDLVSNGYLALIHADGNDVGRNAPGDDAGNARFFHRNRVLLRRAAQKAIDAHCPEHGQAPLIPLMLGGDDLLIVCRAAIALPFVASLCEELDALQADEKGFRLTLGAGVVISKHTVPIHRLHQVAEQLASSAKRRFRGFVNGEPKRSVVDWAVYTTAWADEPDEIRRRDWLRGQGADLRVLSQRPLDVLGDGLSSLKGLVSGASMLEKAPRSQLRYLLDQLPRGKSLSELAFAELSDEARSSLTAAGVSHPWRKNSATGPWLTSLLDLIEVSEIQRLGRNVQDTHVKKVTAHG